MIRLTIVVLPALSSPLHHSGTVPQVDCVTYSINTRISLSFNLAFLSIDSMSLQAESNVAQMPKYGCLVGRKGACTLELGRNQKEFFLRLLRLADNSIVQGGRRELMPLPGLH